MMIVKLILMLCYAALILYVAWQVLKDNREPAKTMAWLLVLFFIPVLGLLLYYFFGANTRKERLISKNSLDQLTKRSMMEYEQQENLKQPESHATLMEFFVRQNDAYPFKNNEVEIFTGGKEFFPVLMEQIAKAKHHIHIDIYIFADDELGNQIADALIEKAQQGVEVRVIYDDVGNLGVKRSFYERMRQGGVDVHAFLPVLFPSLTSKVNYRNHRKLIVIDGIVGFIGGMNFATRYISGRGGQAWRDTQLMIRGGAVYGIQRAFLVDWYFVDHTLITDHKYYPTIDPAIDNDCLAQVVTSSPVAPWPDIMHGYMRILMEAKSYVYMESPYFLPTEPILFAMRSAALTGVDVRLMIPMKGDSKLVEWASISYVMETLAAGVKVYLYKAGFNHSKLLVSDDYVCTCGSTNVDFRSFEQDFESNIFFYDKEMALRMKKVFLDDQSQCIHISEIRDVMHQTFWRRLWESILRLFSPLL